MNVITFESFAVNDENYDLLDEAIDAAFGVIQSKFDVKSGSVSGPFLVGPKRASLRACFRQTFAPSTPPRNKKSSCLNAPQYGIAGNNGSFGSVIFSVLPPTKPTAGWTMCAASITATTI